jgi:hypothetical protein
MTVLYKAQVTRSSLDDLFFFEFLPGYYYNNYFIHPYLDIVDLNEAGLFPKCISYTIKEMISWDEVFLRKDELRPDLKYQINSKNLTKDDMYGIGPLYNPFSLTLTELAEYNSWEDAMSAYDTFFDRTYVIIDMLKQSNNTYIQEHYINGIKVEDWVSKMKV